MQKTIIVVDDNDVNLTVARNALKDQYRVLTAPSAAKMFSLLEKITPDIILLDIEMPEMDGFEAAKRLKSRPSYADLAVIFLTGSAHPDFESKGRELGIADFIIKPFSVSALLESIKTRLGD